MDCSDTAREQSHFQQFVYPSVGLKENHVATMDLQDLPASFPASLPRTLPHWLSYHPSDGLFPTPESLHRVFLLPRMLYPLCLMQLLLLIPRLKVTSSEKAYLSVIKLATFYYFL